jgi:superfamily II DNA or RNA helicase
MGLGKSLITINRIKKGNYKNILITGYRTSLKSNWLKELEKWRIYKWEDYGATDNEFDIQNGPRISIDVINIQTVYRWNKTQLCQFDLVILDEIHELATPEYGKLIVSLYELGISRVGLTGTPDLKNKKEFYDKYCPILMEYYDVEGTITNKVKLFLYEYELTDAYKVEAGNATKRWKVGELKQYTYLSEKYEEAKNKMFELGASEYWDTSMLWMKGVQKVWITDKEGVPELVDEEATKEQKEWGRKFFNFIRYRKEFLWNLSSSVAYANNIKYRILSNPDNKVFLFTKSITQTYRLSPNVIHSKVAKTAKDVEALNKHTLEKFNDGIIRELASVNSLTSGVNIKGLNWILVDAFDSSEVKGQQIKGRGRRLDISDEANMIVIVPKDTQSARWFKNSYGSTEYELLTDLNDLKI